jgi:uncharacterized protein (DUF58 family)
MRWFVGILILLGLALALQAGLVAFVGYVLLGVLVVSRYLAKTWIESLAAVRTCDRSPREIGDSIEVSLELTNTGSLPIPWLLIEDLVPESTFRQKPPRLVIKGKRLHLLVLGPRGTKRIRYTVTFAMRGYYPLGPTTLETGDVFGLHRRHRIVGEPAYILVYPKVLPLPRYDFASQRPIGEVRLANRLFEDPTRNAGVRPYVVGDPLQRVHWKATARTGQLHCRVYEPTSLAGASVLLDFHEGGYPKRGEPHRSDLAVTTAASIAYAVSMLNQQIGFATNGRDAADRIREESLSVQPSEEIETRDDARSRFELRDENDRLRPVHVETRRGIEQFEKIREALARLELTDGLSFAGMILDIAARLPRDATAICILPRAPIETAIALGTLRRRGFAVTAILVGLSDSDAIDAQARLLTEGIRDVRRVNSEAELVTLGGRPVVETTAASPYAFDAPHA